MKNEDIILKSGDKIHILIYLDHATIKTESKDITKSLQDIINDPHCLWCCGKIIEQEINPDYYIVLCSGAFNRWKKPYNYEMVLKNAVIFKKEIFTIP